MVASLVVNTVHTTTTVNHDTSQLSDASLQVQVRCDRANAFCSVRRLSERMDATTRALRSTCDNTNAQLLLANLRIKGQATKIDKLEQKHSAVIIREDQYTLSL